MVLTRGEFFNLVSSLSVSPSLSRRFYSCCALVSSRLSLSSILTSCFVLLPFLALPTLDLEITDVAVF